MGRQQYVVRTGPTALTVTGALKTAILIPSGSGSLFTVVEIGFSIDSAVAAPAVGVELSFFVLTGGVGTSTSATPSPVKQGTGISPQTGNAAVNFTGEPTGTFTTIKDWFVPPTGLLVVQFPLGREPESFPGTNNRIALRYNNPATGSTANFRAYIEYEE
jgi:hypothetical protein